MPKYKSSPKPKLTREGTTIFTPGCQTKALQSKSTLKLDQQTTFIHGYVSCPACHLHAADLAFAWPDHACHHHHLSGLLMTGCFCLPLQADCCCPPAPGHLHICSMSVYRNSLLPHPVQMCLEGWGNLRRTLPSERIAWDKLGRPTPHCMTIIPAQLDSSPTLTLLFWWQGLIPTPRLGGSRPICYRPTGSPPRGGIWDLFANGS